MSDQQDHPSDGFAQSDSFAQQDRFALYYTYDRTHTKDLTAAQKKELIECINSLSDEQLKMMAMLIDEHKACETAEQDEDDRSETPSAVTIPYGGTQKSDGVHFDLSRIPIPLRHIMLRFARSQKMK